MEAAGHWWVWPALELAGCRPVGPRSGVNLLRAGQFLPLADALGASQSCCQPAGELGKILEPLAEGHSFLDLVPA